MSNRTVVKIRNLRLPFSIGVLDHERLAKQEVIISVEMQVLIPEKPTEAEQNYVSYAPVVEHLRGVSGSGRHIDLVEQLADEVFGLLFRDARVACAKVEIMKPDIFAEAEAVGVEIERENLEFRGSVPRSD